MDKSHEDFVELVLHNDHLGDKGGRKYSRRDLEDLCNGEFKDELLSVCFEYWSYGETGKVAKLLGAKSVTEIPASLVNPALLEGRQKLEAREAALTKKKD